MKKIILAFFVCTLCALPAVAAGRGATASVRENAGVRVSGASVSRSASVPRKTGTVATRTARTRRPVTTASRGAITTAATRKLRTIPRNAARAALLPTGSVQTFTFDDHYTECQQAYFTCMDQFCALRDEKYRRCTCSSKLETIMARERALENASGQLQDFKNLNLESILKTKDEVKAMLNASEGELKLSNVRDKSESVKKLTAIGDVLNAKKTAATSTNGHLDIAGDIRQVWTTTDLISGDTIANLNGPALYNAVHAQCSELIRTSCPSTSTMNMITSAYGMYIENDCALLTAALDKQATTANAAIRETNREMSTARIDNYNAHNSTSINDCVAAVRENLTADMACGSDYVHCLDITGLYLNRQTGEPIYTPNFFQLNKQLSISGNILTNSENSHLIAELNRKKNYATKSLEACRDISDAVWDEFLRVAVTEIYQGQQEKIRQVKDECMDVVNQCYDTTVLHLRDFSNLDNQMLVGSRLVLAEEMCQDKLTSCSNLYGGGTDGFELLVQEMHQIIDQKIAQNCHSALQEYAKKLCDTPGIDLHGYPYGCRTYSPGGKIDDDETTLYTKIKNYAGQYCVRTSENDTYVDIPLNVLGDVNMVMDSIRSDMSNILATECEKLGGQWNTVFDSENTTNKHEYFYNSTNANMEWGLCYNTTE